jgi:hypothetical protein
MAKKNVQGVCRLCGKRKTLCRSHYLGRAIQRLCRENGKDAVMMTPKVIMETQRQLWAHLLCRECEGRLNKFGETPVLRLLDNGSAFPLLSLMSVAMHVKAEPGVVTFSGSAMGINTDALGHFALGILWKGGVHKWSTVGGQTTSVNLRGYISAIRRYLLGKGGIPKGIFVIVAVCEDKGSRGMVFAPARLRGSRYKQFSMLVRGLWFHIIVDERARGMKGLCCVQSDKRVLHLENCHTRMMQAAGHLHKSARVAPSLAR